MSNSNACSNDHHPILQYELKQPQIIVETVHWSMEHDMYIVGVAMQFVQCCGQVRVVNSTCCCYRRAGLCCVCLGAAIPSPVHVPQEEPQQEDYGVLFLMQLGQVPFRAPQLHRHTCAGHTCECKLALVLCYVCFLYKYTVGQVFNCKGLSIAHCEIFQ